MNVLVSVPVYLTVMIGIGAVVVVVVVTKVVNVVVAVLDNVQSLARRSRASRPALVGNTVSMGVKPAGVGSVTVDESSVVVTVSVRNEVLVAVA